MTGILVTGMSGTGKSTVLAELARRGHETLDTDYGPWVGPDGRWDATLMADFLDTHPRVVISGTVENQGDFYSRFGQIVLLSAPLETLLERVTTRTGNPYGSSPEQRDEIARYLRDVEPLLRRGATVELDALQPIASIADAIGRMLDA